MGGAPYKSAKEGVGALLSVSAFNQRCVYSDLKPSKQISGHKITYCRITSGFKVESWRSEQHDVTMSIV